MDPKPPETNNRIVGRLTEEIAVTLQEAISDGKERGFSLPFNFYQVEKDIEHSFVQESRYAMSFIGKLPKPERIGFPTPEERASSDLYFEMPAQLYSRLSIKDEEKEVLDDVMQRYFGENHYVYPTNLPNVFYHSLDVEVGIMQGDLAGDTFRFFTVNIPIEKIRDLSKSSGAIKVSYEESMTTAGMRKLDSRFE